MEDDELYCQCSVSKRDTKKCTTIYDSYYFCNTCRKEYDREKLKDKDTEYSKGYPLYKKNGFTGI